MASTPNPAAKLQHVRPVRPLHFPESEPAEEHLGQSKRHLALCTLLAELLKRVCAPQHSYGADQFVYWNPRAPKTCLAPDGFVKLGVPDDAFDSWKTWERGIPELAVEVLSPSDTPESETFGQKLERYHELGVRELVCFDVDATPGARLRVWDLIEGDLVERVVEHETSPCVTLSVGLADEFEWAIAPGAGEPTALRLRRAGSLVLSAAEGEAAERLRAEAALKSAERAEARVEVAVRERDAADREAADAKRELAELRAKLGSSR